MYQTLCYMLQQIFINIYDVSICLYNFPPIKELSLIKRLNSYLRIIQLVKW